MELTPAQAVVVAGILLGVLDVDSFLISKDQDVEIVLSGSLKRKSKLDKMMDELGNKSFDEVAKAFLDRFG